MINILAFVLPAVVLINILIQTRCAGRVYIDVIAVHTMVIAHLAEKTIIGDQYVSIIVQTAMAIATETEVVYQDVMTGITVHMMSVVMDTNVFSVLTIVLPVTAL